MWHFFYCAESSFSNDDSERLEDQFEKRSEVFVPNTSNIKSLFHFIHNYCDLRDTDP
jgi:hypothetical protein